jgi:3(or 17)beta-hydroxysteroid dehydrogenase
VSGKVAWVTGGGSGLGEATASLFVREGARVAISDLRLDSAARVADALNQQHGRPVALALKHDVAEPAEWASALDTLQTTFGPLDILVNNAGILLRGGVADGSLADFMRSMQVNAASVFIGCQLALRAMAERGGAIVNVASVASWLPVEGYAAYAASKAAVASLTRSTALHCRRQRLPIRVNSVHPDGIHTPMMTSQLPANVPASALLFDPRRNPAGRAVPPEQIARTIVFLASDDAQAIHGAQVQADQGILGMGL